jgi:hypothetical protein
MIKQTLKTIEHERTALKKRNVEAKLFDAFRETVRSDTTEP